MTKQAERNAREQVAVLNRRLANATDKQLLLLNKLIDAEARIVELERRADDAKGKPCPACAGAMVSLTSLNQRICSSCDSVWSWELAPGQLPLFANNRLRKAQ